MCRTSQKVHFSTSVEACRRKAKTQREDAWKLGANAVGAPGNHPEAMTTPWKCSCAEITNSCRFIRLIFSDASLRGGSFGPSFLFAAMPFSEIYSFQCLHQNVNSTDPHMSVERLTIDRYGWDGSNNGSRRSADDIIRFFKKKNPSTGLYIRSNAKKRYWYFGGFVLGCTEADF